MQHPGNKRHLTVTRVEKNQHETGNQQLAVYSKGYAFPTRLSQANQIIQSRIYAGEIDRPPACQLRPEVDER